MAGGGPGRGGGRKPGVGIKRLTAEAIKQAKKQGLLPHEWLVKVMNGEPIEHSYEDVLLDQKGNVVSREVKTKMVYPDFETRVDAAKAAAPYYAPRLMAQSLSLKTAPKTVVDTLRTIAEHLPV